MQIHRWIRKAGGLFLTASICLGSALTSYAKPDWPADTGIEADAGIVMDADSKTVLFGQAIHVPMAPASITKILTALVVVENASLSDLVVFSHDAVYNVESGSGNKFSMEEGDILSVEDCLYLLLLQSSNQAANALAEHVAGSREAFADMMNAKIAELGCTESHFTNPSGLNDDDQYVTAYDMALISAAAFENDTVLKISSSRNYTLPATANNPEGVSFNMEHRILMASETSSYYCEGAIAGKIGYTSKAGNTLVVFAERDGKRLVTVILKGSQPQYYYDGINLLNFGFSSFKDVNIAENESLLKGTANAVAIGDKTYPISDLSIDPDAVMTLPNSADFTDSEKVLFTSAPGQAPVGAVAMLQYTYNDRKNGSAYIYSADAIEQARLEALGPDTEEEREDSEVSVKKRDASSVSESISVFFSGFSEFIHKWAGVAAIIIAVLVIALIFIISAYRRRKRKKLEEARRRERRRKRLQEIGYTEEEFDRMVRAQNHQGKSRNSKSSRRSANTGGKRKSQTSRGSTRSGNTRSGNPSSTRRR